MKIRLFTIPNLLTLASLLCGSFAIVSALVYGDLALAFWLTIAAGVSTIPTVSWPGCSNALPPSAYNWTRCPTWSRSASPRRPCFSSCGTIPCLRMPGMAALRRRCTLFRGGGLLGAAAGEIQYRRDAAYRVLRPSDSCQCAVFRCAGLDGRQDGFQPRGWVLLMVPAMSWLLISPVRMFAFKFQSFAFKGNEIRYIFIALAVVLLVALGIPAVPIVILLYIAISAVGWGMSLKPGSAACPEK